MARSAATVWDLSGDTRCICGGIGRGESMRNTFVGVDLRALQAFVAVCETRSMTEAARVLGVTQSAVSQLIASLEREQGVSLFDRDFRPVRPNAAGKILFEQAGALLEHAQAVALNVRAAAKTGVANL